MIYKKAEHKVEYTKYKLSEYMPHKHEGFSTLAIHEGCEP